MKREILFRGKRVDNGEWVEGLTCYDSSGCISRIEVCGMNSAQEGVFEVNPETVGQFTGLLDKNKVKIFEDDILHPSYNRLVPFAVEFNDGKYNCCNYHIPDCKVIGNIHNNPELIS